MLPYPKHTMRLFKFAAPKGPGYGIASNFQLDVLAGTPQLPALLALINPKGEAGAVAGFGAPLTQGATKEDLARPLKRGSYVMASPDKKTVLQMLVFSKEEGGFDPEAVAKSRLAAELSADLLARIRATWMLAQFTVRSHDAAVSPAINFINRLAVRFAELTDGCIADPMAERYLLPEQVPVSRPDQEPVLAVDHVSVRTAPREYGITAFTLGMRKFGLPEIEIDGLPLGSETLAVSFLLGVCQGAFSGRLLRVGDRVGANKQPFTVAEGGLDRGRWEGIAVFELLPPTGIPAEQAMKAWAMEESVR